MNQNVNITIASTTIIKCLLWISMFAALIYLNDFVIALLVAVVLASAAEIPVIRMMRWGLSRAVAVSLVFLSLVAAIVLVGSIFLPPLADDIAQFLKTLPQILESFQLFGRDIGFKDLSAELQVFSQGLSGEQIITVIKNTLFGASGFFATTSVLVGGIVNIVLTFVLAIYLTLEENGVKKVLRLLSPKVYESYVEGLWLRSQAKIGFWMQGQLLLSFIISVLVLISMFILGIPYSALLAVLAFVGELIPMVGITLSMVPGVFIAWSHGGLTLAGIAFIIFIIISQFESHYLYPKIMNRLVGVPSIVVIIAVVVGAKLAGIWGVLLSVPIAAILMEVASDLDKRKNIPHVA